MRFKVTILLFLLLLVGCTEKPVVSIKDIKIEGFKKSDVNLKIFLNVENPNSFSMEILKANYDIYYKNNIIGGGNWKGPMVLEGNSAMIIGIPVLIRGEKFFDVLGLLINSQLLGNSEALKNIRINGRVIIRKMFFEKEVDFHWDYKQKNKGKASDI